MEALRSAAEQYKPVQQILKKQKDNGLWGGNLLGTDANKAFGVKEPGTVARYRQLLELGLARDARPFRLANRWLFRVLSRDPDPALLCEYQKEAKKDPIFATWARDLVREGAVAALVHGGQGKDPRVRGAAKKMADHVSHFLRSDLAANPLVKSGSKYTLHPDAHPPTLHMYTMAAYLPNFRRERGGLVDRLVAYINTPSPSLKYTIQVGKATVHPSHQLLGDPLELDENGRPSDIPFALHWIELLARFGALDVTDSAQLALANLLADCDEEGVWNPKGLRGIPKSHTSLVDFSFPLETDERKTDVTFRLALIAKILGWELEYT